MGTMLRLTKDTIALPPGRKVIKADAYALMLEASAVLEDARMRAASILAEAEAAYEQERERGYQDGLMEGRMEMTERMIDSIATSVDSLERMEITVVDVVMRSLRKILEDMDDKERVVQVVHKALGYVRSQKKVVLKVAPEEHDYVRDAMTDLLRAYPGIGFLDVVPDARLSKGACMLESDMGVVDASLETQLEGIRRAFLKHLSKDKG